MGTQNAGNARVGAGDDAPAPVNEAAYAQASRRLRRLIDAAERGDVAARLQVIEASEAPALRASCARIAKAADACAPSLDQIRIDGNLYSLDQRELRYAANDSAKALSAAAGRTVVAVEPPPFKPPIDTDPDHTHDSGELPRPVGA